MERQHRGQHGEDCFACRIQSVQLAPSATPSRANHNPPPAANPAWERGVVGEHRRDGTFMPYIGDRTMNAIHVKEWGENRRHFEDHLRRESAPS